MATIRDLLTQWAKLEPERCKIETRPNWDWHEEFEDFYIAGEAGNKDEPGHSWGWNLVLTDSEPRGYYPWESEALMRIGWAVQYCLQERGWAYRLEYIQDTSPDSVAFWRAMVHSQLESHDGKTSDYGPVQALLSAYVEALKAEAQP